jgi:hypothetical protein
VTLTRRGNFKKRIERLEKLAEKIGFGRLERTGMTIPEAIRIARALLGEPLVLDARQAEALRVLLAAVESKPA